MSLHNYRCSPTSDVEVCLMTVASVCDVVGNTTENPSIRLLHPGHLQDPHWKEGVPGQGQVKVSKHRDFCFSLLEHGKDQSWYLKPSHERVWMCFTHRVQGLNLSLPAVWNVQRYSVFFPGDVGFRDSVDLTLEASDTALIHRHGHWVGVKLWKSWGGKHTD